MSYMERKSKYAHGVQVFLERQGFDISGSGHRENKIMVKFLKEKGLPYVEWNHKYKGINTADLQNAETIQDHWKEFRDWVLKQRPCPYCGTLMYPYMNDFHMNDYGCPEPACPINNYPPEEDSDVCPDCFGSGEKGVVMDGCANVDVCDTCFGKKRILKQKKNDETKNRKS